MTDLNKFIMYPKLSLETSVITFFQHLLPGFSTWTSKVTRACLGKANRSAQRLLENLQHRKRNSNKTWQFSLLIVFVHVCCMFSQCNVLPFQIFVVILLWNALPNITVSARILFPILIYILLTNNIKLSTPWNISRTGPNQPPVLRGPPPWGAAFFPRALSGPQEDYEKTLHWDSGKNSFLSVSLGA